MLIADIIENNIQKTIAETITQDSVLLMNTMINPFTKAAKKQNK